MVSDELIAIVRCPDCAAPLARDGAGLRCSACGRPFDARNGYLDLRPARSFAEQTRYLDEALHEDARHETVSPPLLSAAVRHGMLRRFLKPAPGDRLVDLGCGSGRVLVWNHELGAHQVGVDVSPFFASEARARVDLALGDLRALPFPDGAFTKAYALDVFEHLSREGLDAVLREAFRILAPGGSLFVYSHVRRNSRLALGLKASNAVAHRLERWHVLDLRQERLRKSDHLNPLADVPDLERTVGAAGFHIARIRFYTPVIGGFIENVLVRVVEQQLGRMMARRAGGPGPPGAADGRQAPSPAAQARVEAKRRVAGRGPTRLALGALTALMKLDVVLWGRIRSGPFFALLVRDAQDGPAR